MDSLLTAAARALAAGDPLAALNRVARRDDPPALALRGIALAQIGDLERARLLLRRAARGFGAGETLSRARCAVAAAEVALAARDLREPVRPLEAAATTLSALGDQANAAQARLLLVRRLLLLGRLDAAAAGLAGLEAAPLPPAPRAICELARAGLALRRLRTAEAAAALARAAEAGRASGIPALQAEIARAAATLHAPAARLRERGGERVLRLAEIESLQGTRTLIVDACRRRVTAGGAAVPLARRPVLFALARALAEAWPGDAARATLVAQAFGGRAADASHRARLRVEVGRLRTLLRPFARVQATPRGFRLVPPRGRRVAVLAPPVEQPHPELLACLADGEAWSSSGLALALGVGPRSVQRALAALQSAGLVQPVGRGRARRWLTPPVPGFAPTMLLPVALPIG